MTHEKRAQCRYNSTTARRPQYLRSMFLIYFKEANVVFFGFIVLALGVERCKLHRRIAIRAILIVGTAIRDDIELYLHFYNNSLC